jgi:hypothetical protein
VSSGSSRTAVLRVRAVLLALCLCVVVAVVAPVSAGAAIAHGFSKSFGTSGSGAGEMALQAFSIEYHIMEGTAELIGRYKEVAPSGVAVDTAGGLVLVADTGNRRVDEFTTAGVFVRAFGADVGGAGVNVCTSECHVGAAGAEAGDLDTPVFIAVDEGEGTVYVGEETEGGGSSVSKFTLAGELVTGWGTGGRMAFGPLGGVAVNGAGELWVYSNNSLFRINASGVVVGSATTPGETARTGMAVNASNRLFTGSTEDQLIAMEPSGVWVGFMTSLAGPVQYGGGPDVTGIGVDEVEGGVFVDERDVVAHLAAGCVPGEDHYLGPFCSPVEEFGAGVLTSGAGVGVDSGSHSVFVADAGSGKVDVFGVVLEGETSAPSGVGPQGAQLNGIVDPEGTEVTSCLFQYGTSESYGREVPCEESAAQIGSGSSPIEVHADVTGLDDASAYHYRLVVRNAKAGVSGQSRSFTTLTLPSIEGVVAEDVSASSAVLAARIDPRGIAASYRIEWGTSTEYGHVVPVPDASLGSGSDGVSVSQSIAGLSANVEYHWRVVASNVNGSEDSPDHTFVYDTEGGGLPDGRAYEMVTPPFKNAELIEEPFLGYGPAISEDGEAFAAFSIQCFAESQSCVAARNTLGEPYLFARGASGWGTTPWAPPASQYTTSTAWMVDPNTGFALFSIPTAPAGEDDWYARSPGGTFTDIGPLTQPSEGAVGVSPLRTVRATGNLSHVVWEIGSEAPLWSFDESREKTSSVYEYVGTGNTHPQLVGVTGPAGSTSLIGICSNYLGNGDGGDGGSGTYNALSADGSVVYFTVRKCGTGSGENLGVKVPAEEMWARVDGERSVLVSGPSPECSGCQAKVTSAAHYEGASVDGSRVFFTDAQKLTSDASEGSGEASSGCATVGGSGCNLYMFEGAGSEDLTQQRLVGVSAGDSSGKGPQVQQVLAISSDGSHVYFSARGVLASNPGAAVDQQTGQAQRAAQGQENLYVYERDAEYPEGHLAFVATLPPNDRQMQYGQNVGLANVTPDGRYLVFESRGALTADDTSVTGAAQVFRYDAQSEQLSRVSIGLHGFNDNGNGSALDARIAPPHLAWSAAGPMRPDPTMAHDGSYVFFQSPVGLTPQALNEVVIGTEGGEPAYAQNIYEWRAQDVTGCERPEGCIALISDGRDTGLAEGGTSSDVELVGSDATGENVFFSSSSPLVAGDTSVQRDYYDARMCTQSSPCIEQPALAQPPCQGEACHGNPVAIPPVPSIPSLTFEGQGNLVQPLVTQTKQVKQTKVKRKAGKHKPKPKRRRAKKSSTRTHGAQTRVRHSANRRSK